MRVLAFHAQTINLKLNVNEGAVIVFPVSAPVTLCLTYREATIPQLASLKYLGVIYDQTMDWRPHINHIATKGERALGLLRRLSNRSFGMRRDTLLFIYRGYMRPILEFGCALFSGSPDYKLRKLIMLEHRALRLCLGLPRCVANNILYLEARIRCLESRFRLLTALTVMRIFESPQSRYFSLMVAQPALFFSSWWPRYIRPQCVYAQTLLSPLSINIPTVLTMPCDVPPAPLTFHNIFPSNAKMLTSRFLQEYSTTIWQALRIMQ